jgi:hypothetical protein
MSKDHSRRAVLAGIAAAPALAAPALALSGAEPDPIYGFLEEHPRLRDRMFEACRSLNDVEEATEERWPCPLVAWRKYSHIGFSEIERARDEFLALPGIDPEIIEQEYREVKADERAKQQALVDWYKRNGMAELKAEQARAVEAERTALLALLTTRPTTIAGLIALLEYAAENSGEHGEREGTDMFNRSCKAISKAGEDFYRHLADSLRAIGDVS